MTALVPTTTRTTRSGVAQAPNEVCGGAAQKYHPARHASATGVMRQITDVRCVLPQTDRVVRLMCLRVRSTNLRGTEVSLALATHASRLQENGASSPRYIVKGGHMPDPEGMMMQSGQEAMQPAQAEMMEAAPAHMMSPGGHLYMQTNSTRNAIIHYL